MYNCYETAIFLCHIGKKVQASKLLKLCTLIRTDNDVKETVLVLVTASSVGYCRFSMVVYKYNTILSYVGLLGSREV